MEKILIFFKKQVQKKIAFSVTKNLANSIIQIFKDIKLRKSYKNFVLLSPSAASFDQFKNFEEREMNLRGCVRFMSENIFKFLLIDYWRSIDKKILFCFLILFFWVYFFSFSSTSSLAGERLNKNYYFFLQNILFLLF